MVETVTINGTEVEVRETENGYEAREPLGLEEQFREDINLLAPTSVRGESGNTIIAEPDQPTGFTYPEFAEIRDHDDWHIRKNMREGGLSLLYDG